MNIELHIFQERSRQYWPSCGSECYGKFLVDELRERDDECENVVVRELNVTYTEVLKCFTGKLFTFYLLKKCFSFHRWKRNHFSSISGKKNTFLCK